MPRLRCLWGRNLTGFGERKVNGRFRYGLCYSPLDWDLACNVSPEMNRYRAPGTIALSLLAGSLGLLPAIACSAHHRPRLVPPRLAAADKPQPQESLSKGQGPKSGPCMETIWWRRRGIEPLVQRKTHSDIYKLSRRLHLARRTSTDGVTDGPAD